MPAFAAVRKFGGARLRANDDLERRGGRASIRPATPQPQGCETRSSSKTRSAKTIAGERTAAVQKINGARINEITLQDVEELLSVVDPAFAHTGTIQKGEVKIFLQEVLAFTCSDTEIETLHSFIDTDDDGNLTAQEFHQALTDRPVQQYMRMLQSEQRVRRRFTQVTGQYSSISRDFLLQQVRKRVQRDDAFQTLPFTICYVLVFLLLVDSHLQILTRHKVRRSLEGWMSNFGSDLAGPFLAESVVSVDSMGRWLETSGMGAIFGECKPNRNGKPWCHLADRNILVGDVELTQYRRDGTTPSEWLLRESAEARVRDQSATASLLDASRERVRHLWDSGWVDSYTQEIRISFTSYNRRRRMFAVTQVTAIFRHGFVVAGVKTAAVDVDPYRGGYLLVALDVLFGGFLIFSLQQEVRDLFMTCRLQGAATGLTTYMGFWNAVDWLSIAIGATSAAVWALCCSAAQGPTISSLLGGDVRSAVLDTDVMSLDEANLRDLKAELCSAVGHYFCLQLLLAALVASIMLKFFKAFHANLRLQLVTGTLARASDDMFHWGIVFTVVFVAFARAFGAAAPGLLALAACGGRPRP